ncbi:hypothetical protein KIN20_005785 [Parelaphostrongylus tenuis]|uniref:Uncharacterized protein n=1 Tax=Parelaphostrongylus tenuis TaxID=148309 RepID=A0AAD5M2N5_PARTN|nr:hypothetical protein KIN20_005785 [Parelaphostrongylus tenuis]
MDREQFTASDIRYIESMIASMRVNELQTVLSMFKMPKLGKKQELIQRCTELLRTPSVQFQVASQVKLLVGKNARVSPYQIPVRGYVPPSNGAAINGNSTAYTQYRGSQLMPPMHSSALQQCRVLRNLVPMDLPFFDVHQILLDPMELPSVLSGVKTPCKQSFSFSVPRERLGNWSQSAPLPRFEIQLRFFQVPQNYNSQELADDFPLNCIVRIEDQLVQLPAVIPTNKPNVEPKRPSRPVDITQNCDKRTWAVAVYLVHRLTSEILRDRATGDAACPLYENKEAVNHWQEEHVTRDVIRARLSGSNDDEIAMAQLKISLLCPLSRTRITLPARCKKCSHLQCFDLYNYLQMNEKRPTWRCPVCSDWAPYKQIIIDGYFKTLLANVDEHAIEVELLVDGSYRTVASECIDVDDDDDIPSMSTANSTTNSNQNQSTNKIKQNVDDVIVISDSDDDEREAVDQAILRSLSETGPMSATPTPRSRDSSIIILDDESPPRPATTLSQNTPVNCSSSSLPSVFGIPTSTSASEIVSCPISSSTITTSSVLGAASRIAPSHPHNVLSGRQNIYNTSSLSYYHQSQWSQPTTSRPQYPTSHPHGSLNAGTNFAMTYKQPSQTPFNNMLGRYQPSNPTSLPFSYPNSPRPSQVPPFGSGGPNSVPAQVQPFSTSSANLQQVLASLVQQSAYNNSGGSSGTMSS